MQVSLLLWLAGLQRVRAVAHAAQFVLAKVLALCAKLLTWINLRPSRGRSHVSHLKYLALNLDFQLYHELESVILIQVEVSVSA